jgi:putative transposase
MRRDIDGNVLLKGIISIGCKATRTIKVARKGGSMARRLRVEYPGAVYHIMNRGDRRERIFIDDGDRELFLTTLGEACKKTGWIVHAYCLMPNHFHLVIETPLANLVAGMKWLLAVYTLRFNQRHKLSGHLFGGRYKSLIVDGSGDGYLKTVCDYVHLNPVRAKLITAEQRLSDYRWSSYRWYLKAPSSRPVWLMVQRLFGEWGVPFDSAAGRREFGRSMEVRRANDNQEGFKALRRGWYFGDKEFRQELLEQIDKRRRPYHYGDELHESAEAKAERMIREALERKGWMERNLRNRPKKDPFKLQLAVRLRAETTVTTRWIATRLQMGTREYLVHLLYRQHHLRTSN